MRILLTIWLAPSPNLFDRSDRAQCGGVWIRVYNEVAEKATAPVEDPRKFARDLLAFVEAAVEALAKKEDGEKWWSYADGALEAAAETGAELTCESGPGQGSVQQVHMCLVALKHVFESNPGTEDEAASRHLPLLFKLLKAKVRRRIGSARFSLQTALALCVLVRRARRRAVMLTVRPSLCPCTPSCFCSFFIPP